MNSSAPCCVEQSPSNSSTADVAAAGEKLQSKSAEQLAAVGFAPAIAEQLALLNPPELTEKIVAYWKNGAGGVKLPGTGLLVNFLRAPTVAGFFNLDGEWHGPKVNPLFASRSPPAKADPPTLVQIERARNTLAEKVWQQRIASGCCPNGHGFLTGDRCQKCGFIKEKP